MRQVTQFLCILFFVNTFINEGQELNGVATYKFKLLNSSVPIDTTKVKDPLLQLELQEMIVEKFEKYFELAFNKKATIYKEKTEEDFIPTSIHQENGIKLNIVSNRINNIFYLNLKEETYVEQSSISSKLFLIKDRMEKKEWQLENETKKIHEYTCYKAIRKEKIISSGQREFNDKNIQYRTITAWYTPQIPISSGPFKYNGLPGLILEVNDGIKSITCSEIIINPKTKIEFEEPSNGEVITAKKFRALKKRK